MCGASVRTGAASPVTKGPRTDLAHAIQWSGVALDAPWQSGQSALPALGAEVIRRVPHDWSSNGQGMRARYRRKSARPHLGRVDQNSAAESCHGGLLLFSRRISATDRIAIEFSLMGKGMAEREGFELPVPQTIDSVEYTKLSSIA